jgi:hypothetical protein
MPSEKELIWNTGVIVPFPSRELFPLGSPPKDRALGYRRVAAPIFALNL